MRAQGQAALFTVIKLLGLHDITFKLKLILY